MKLFDALFGRKQSAGKEAPAPSVPLTQTPAWQTLPENFAVTDADSARAFFMACEADDQIMTQHFPEKIYEDFRSVTDYQMRCAFTKAFALNMFDSALNGTSDRIPAAASKVFRAAQYWGMDFYDDEIIEKLTAVAKASNSVTQRTNDLWIGDFLQKYNNSGKQIMKVQPLVNQTYDYLMQKYPDNTDYFIGELIKLCSTLKGLMLEASEPDPALEMEFSLAEEQDIDRFLGEFSSLCNGSAGHIKGMIHQLNCVYGIRTPAFFLTAANDAVDSGSNRSFDTFRFAVIFFQENVTAVFECWRHQDGLFYPESRFRKQYPVLEQYQDVLAKAIAFYRNREASEAFRKQTEAEHPGFRFTDERYTRQEQLCKRYGDCFSGLRERIRDQSISQTLTELLDCCEIVCPMIGIDQTAFYPPASEADIRECEVRTGITIPLPMREFLMFSNGASLFENSTTIWNTSEIGKITLDGYDDENAEIYLPIGDFIGDGTQFVLHKTSGEIGEYDHETGEVSIYGDFEDFLGEIMEFHCRDYMD